MWQFVSVNFYLAKKNKAGIKSKTKSLYFFVFFPYIIMFFFVFFSLSPSLDKGGSEKEKAP